jgi:hypothetical protein
MNPELLQAWVEVVRESWPEAELSVDSDDEIRIQRHGLPSRISITIDPDDLRRMQAHAGRDSLRATIARQFGELQNALEEFAERLERRTDYRLTDCRFSYGNREADVGMSG